jgi:hypothetical protein
LALALALSACAESRPPSTGAPPAPDAADAAGARATDASAAGRYLALGDSFTIGTGSVPAQAFPGARRAARSRSRTLR